MCLLKSGLGQYRHRESFVLWSTSHLTHLCSLSTWPDCWLSQCYLWWSPFSSSMTQQLHVWWVHWECSMNINLPMPLHSLLSCIQMIVGEWIKICSLIPRPSYTGMRMRQESCDHYFLSRNYFVLLSFHNETDSDEVVVLSVSGGTCNNPSLCTLQEFQQ